jgi:hypothetical protein
MSGSWARVAAQPPIPAAAKPPAPPGPTLEGQILNADFLRALRDKAAKEFDKALASPEMTKSCAFMWYGPGVKDYHFASSGNKDKLDRHASPGHTCAEDNVFAKGNARAPATRYFYSLSIQEPAKRGGSGSWKSACAKCKANYNIRARGEKGHEGHPGSPPPPIIIDIWAEAQRVNP